MKRVDLRSRGCHAFPQSRLGVWEARLGAFGSGQLVDDDVMPSPGAAGYLLRFNADAVPVEKALLAIVVLHAPKIAPRLQPMTVRSREARTDFAVQGSFQPRDGVADGATVQRRSHALQGGLRSKGGFLRSPSTLLAGCAHAQFTNLQRTSVLPFERSAGATLEGPAATALQGAGSKRRHCYRTLCDARRTSRQHGPAFQGHGVDRRNAGRLATCQIPMTANPRASRLGGLLGGTQSAVL